MARKRSRFEGFQFVEPPKIDTGMLSKLIYGDEGDDEMLDYLKLAQAAEQSRRKEEREGAESAANIEAKNLENQIAMAKLANEVSKMQQEGGANEVDALLELIKNAGTPMAGQPDPAARYRKALERKIPELAEVEKEERKAARGKRGGDVTKELAAVYEKGNPRALKAQMMRLEPEFAEDPELVNLVNWQGLKELWPVEETPTANAPGRMAAPQPTAEGAAQPWSYTTGYQRIPEVSQSRSPAAFEYAPGGPSAMPGEIDPGLIRQLLQQREPLRRPGSVANTYRYGTGVEMPAGPEPSIQEVLSLAVPGLGSINPNTARMIYSLPRYLRERELPEHVLSGQFEPYQ